MRLDHVSNVHSTPVPVTARPAATADGPAAAPAAARNGPAGASFSATATWQWSVSLQVTTVLNGGSATTPATVDAPESAVGRTDDDHHGRPHVSQMLRQLSRQVRHELQSIIRNNPDLDPAVRDELRDAAKAFRDDLRTAFHDAGQGHDFDPAALLDGVSQALTTLADRLGRVIAEEPQPAEPVPVPVTDPAPEPAPERPAAELPTETPVPAAA